MSLGATRTHFRTHAPRGFFVHNDRAYAFNAYRAPLGTVRAHQDDEHEVTDIYVYNDACAPWLSSAARIQYFERLAAVEMHFSEVLWFWDDGGGAEFYTKKPSVVILKQAEKLT
jgi:hypothetical protein